MQHVHMMLGACYAPQDQPPPAMMDKKVFDMRPPGTFRSATPPDLYT